MRATFHLKTLTVAIATLSIASITNAAGLDRSGQDVTAFLQDGTYAEAVYTYIDADVSGYDNQRVATDDAGYVKGRSTGEVAESYDFFRYGVKADINDTFSVGVLYDEPFGAAADYSGDNNFVAQGDRNATINAVSGGKIKDFASAAQTVGGIKYKIDNKIELTPTEQAQYKALAPAVAAAQAEFNTKGEGTNVEVRTENITAILGMKFGENKNFQVYGGPVAQQVQA